MSADFKAAKERARRLLKKYGYEHPPIDPEYVAECEGVEVVYADFEAPFSDEISGFYDPAANQIVVNKAIPPNRKTYTIAHELAHFLLHREYAESEQYKVLPRKNGYEDGTKPAVEQEADAFAAELLVPISMLRDYAYIGDAEELSRIFCVSRDALSYRMKWL
jgi:Zn-dependent peptidase ImmA (M78 family)